MRIFSWFSFLLLLLLLQNIFLPCALSACDFRGASVFVAFEARSGWMNDC